MSNHLLIPVLICNALIGGEPPAPIPGADAFVNAITTQAEQGQAQAQYILGMMNEDAICFPQDFSVAFRWLKKAADQGQVEAQYEVAVLYSNGHGVSSDQVAAVKYLRLAVDQGHVRSMRLLALKYARGLGTKRNESESHNLTTRAAEAGDMESQVILGDWFAKGTVSPDFSKALAWYRAAADKGLPVALFRVGTCLEQGMGVEADPPQAMTWYYRAADRHQPDALLRLSTLMASGDIQPRDPQLIAKWREESDLQAGRSSNGMPGGTVGGVVGGQLSGVAPNTASQGTESTEVLSPEAQVAKGSQYEHGRLVKRNLTEALRCYRMAATQGLAPACYLTGKFYERGMGVTANPKEALVWFEKGAELKDSDCMLHLAFMCEYGIAKPRDPKQAAIWRSKVPAPQAPEAKALLPREGKSPGGISGTGQAVEEATSSLRASDGSTSLADPKRVIDFDFSQIRIRHQPPAPPYPPLAKIAKIQGTVVVEITVGPDGVPEATNAIEGPPQLKPAAEDYAAHWRFMPALLNGAPVYARFRLTMPFRLQ